MTCADGNCQCYPSVDSLLAAWKSPAQTEALLQWIHSSACRGRVRVSYALLNALRETTSREPVAAVRTAPAPKKSDKRRIRPVLLQTEWKPSQWPSLAETTEAAEPVQTPTKAGPWKQRGAIHPTPVFAPIAPPVDETKPEESLDETEELNHLQRTYTALIHACLVPSTVVELQFLVRLLALPVAPTSGPLQSILSSAARVSYLARSSLEALQQTIRGLPVILQDRLQKIPVIRRELPSLIGSLPPLPPPTDPRTPMLTQAFQPERDSRHNRSPVTYKNREQTRDAFLSALRSPKSRSPQTWRSVLHNLSDENLPWFCELWVEMLLQLGLAPLQETDEEILKMAKNSDKVQQLHGRISKRSQTKKQMGKAEDKERKESAQILFPGHQEFFFHFLTDTDSYKFNQRLRVHLLQTLLDRSSTLEDDGSVDKVLDCCLLARFVGFLYFSPNWDIPSTEAHPMASGLVQLEHAGLSILDRIERAWKSRCLTTSLPWILDLMRLASWDTATQTSETFCDLLRCLRSIQMSLVAHRKGEESVTSVVATKRSFVSLSIEELIGGWFSLSRAAAATPWELPGIDEGNTTDPVDSLDEPWHIPLDGYGTSHLEEFRLMLDSLVHDDAPFKAKRASRKLRPSVVGPTLLRTSPVSGSPTASLELLTSQSNSERSSSIQIKLRDNFFHRHQELREIGEFVATRAFQRFQTGSASDLMETELSKLDSSSLEAEAGTAIMPVIRQVYDREMHAAIAQSYDLLLSRTYEESVRSVAISLIVNHTWDALASASFAAKIHLAARKHFQQMAPVHLFDDDNGKKKVSKSAAVDETSEELSRGASLLQRIVQHVAGDDRQTATILMLMTDACESISRWTNQSIPKEAAARTFVQSALDMDDIAEQLLDWFLTCDERTDLVNQYITLVCLIRQRLRHGVKSFESCLETKLSKMLECVGGDHDMIQELVRARVISRSRLERLLEESSTAA